MNPIPYPPWWDGAGIDAKASWLVASHHAKNYAAACSMLAKARRKKPVKTPPAKMWYQDEIPA